MFASKNKGTIYVLKEKNDSFKGRCYVFSSYKLTNKVCLVYSECKQQQHKYGLCIFKAKNGKKR